MMTPALFSVSYAGLWGQHKLDIPAFIAKAAALGYPAVELMGKAPHLAPWNIDTREVEQIKECAARHHVEIATIAGYTDFTSGKTAPEVPFRDMQIAYVRTLAKVAAQLGAKIVRVFTGYATSENAYLEDWDKCVLSIRECAKVAEDVGVMLGVQNHHDTAISSDAYGEFLHEINHPNCRAMFDPWAPALMGEDLPKYAALLAPLMVQTTLADYLRLPRFAYMPGLVNYKPLPEMVRAVPLGEGFIDLEGFFAGLKKGGFQGYVAYEMCSPLRGGGSEENLDKTAQVSLAKIRQLIKAG
jgi:sugar phosphate isomerase/epimerase